jgi:hypothetical protein
MATDGKVTFWDADAQTKLPAYNAQELRQLDSPLLMPGPASAPFSGRSGRQVNGSGLAVTVDPTGAGSVTVSQGAGVIYDGSYAVQGAWRFATSGAKTVALAARPGSGTSRIDLVVARIYDSALAGAGSVKELKIEVVTGGGSFGGTVGATPTAPSLPPLSLLLSTLTVTSTSGAAISKTDTTAVTVAAGGILPVATTAEMNALKTAGIAYRGLVVDNAQTGVLHRYNGTDWKVLDPSYAINTPNIMGSTAPGPSDPIYRKIGLLQGTTDNFGILRLTFSSPFPNGLLHISTITTAGAGSNPVVNGTGTPVTKSYVDLIWVGVNNAAVKASYEAVGW